MIIFGTKGDEIQVDDDIAGFLVGCNLYVDRNNVVAIKLHHLVSKSPPSGGCVDHINGDKLDNRRANLRWATLTQNSQNRGPTKGRRYIGVSFYPGKYKPYKMAVVSKKVKYWSYFFTEEEAAKARDLCAIQAYGEFARLNFPHVKYSAKDLVSASQYLAGRGYNKNQSDSLSEAHIRQGKGKPFVCVETGQVFRSILEAAKALGVTKGAIKHVLSGRLQRVKGVTFKRLDKLE